VSRSPRPRETPPEREEVEGFLEGVTLRLAHASVAERGRHDASLSKAKRCLERGDLVGAESRLVAIDSALQAAEGEPELSEFPRGLVGYVAKGDRGHPTRDDEEPLANRIRLVARLIEVRRSEGRDVEEWVRALGEAQRAYTEGDRPTARHRCDAVLREVETETARRPATEA
jgi:hypothetical protein